MKRKRVIREETTPKSSNKRHDENSKYIFTQTFPVIGEVPIAFFIPESKSRDKLKKLIEDHGGIILNTFEPYMYQIKIEKETKKSK